MQVVYVEERINSQTQHIVRHVTCTVKIMVMSTNSITQTSMVRTYSRKSVELQYIITFYHTFILVVVLVWLRNETQKGLET